MAGSCRPAHRLRRAVASGRRCGDRRPSSTSSISRGGHGALLNPMFCAGPRTPRTSTAGRPRSLQLGGVLLPPLDHRTSPAQDDAARACRDHERGARVIDGQVAVVGAGPATHAITAVEGWGADDHLAVDPVLLPRHGARATRSAPPRSRPILAVWRDTLRAAQARAPLRTLSGCGLRVFRTRHRTAGRPVRLDRPQPRPGSPIRRP